MQGRTHVVVRREERAGVGVRVEEEEGEEVSARGVAAVQLEDVVAHAIDLGRTGRADKVGQRLSEPHQVGAAAVSAVELAALRTDSRLSTRRRGCQRQGPWTRCQLRARSWTRSQRRDKIARRKSGSHSAKPEPSQLAA